jgi:hypothetical protein
MFQSIQAQDSKENWVSVSVNASETLYINVTGISVYTEDDIYVWVLQETKEPIIMDGIEADIYKTKTYYLINKKMMRYSIMQVMYFDNHDNILKSYTYNHSMENIEFKYCTPIMLSSEVEKILLKCKEYIHGTTINEK